MGKIKLFLDFDSTLVNTSELLLKYLNEEHGTCFEISALKKYDYSDLFPGVTKKDLKKYFNSDRFFDELEFIPGATELLNHFDISVVTRASDEEAAKKTHWLNMNLNPSILFRLYNIKSWENKSKVDMKDGIFIDDVIDNLRVSNAKIKILYVPNPDAEWTQYGNRDEIYVVSSWKEINNILRFYLEVGGIV